MSTPSCRGPGAPLTALLLAACASSPTGPAPLGPYSVRSVATFAADGAPSTQEIVAECGASTPSTDAAAYRVDGERHWLQRADGSLLLLGDLEPCRWRDTPPPAGEVPLLSEEMVHPDAVAQRVYDSVSWVLDDPARPNRAEAWSTPHLFSADGAAGVHVQVVLHPGLGARTTTLADRFPGLAPTLADSAWSGVRASVWALQGGLRCEGGDTPGLRPIDPDDRCQRAPSCAEAKGEPCRAERGGLRPTRDAATGRLDFALVPDLAYRFRVDHPAASPIEACLEGQCTNAAHAAYVDPARGLVVDLRFVSERPTP